MEREIFKNLENAQAGSQEAMCFLLEKFEPLLRFAARSLEYEDAYEDIVAEWIAAIKKLDLTALRNTQDPGLVCYFRSMVRNFIPLLAKRRRSAGRWICLSALGEGTLWKIEREQACTDVYEALVCWEIHRLLTPKEYVAVYLFFFRDLSIAQIAARLAISRQAANRLKLRGLQRLRQAWEDEAV